MTIDFQHSRQLLQEFKFDDLFIHQLGWNNPSPKKALSMTINGEKYTRQKIAELSKVVVFEITADAGQIPNAKIREAIYRDISQLHLENL